MRLEFHVDDLFDKKYFIVGQLKKTKPEKKLACYSIKSTLNSYIGIAKVQLMFSLSVYHYVQVLTSVPVIHAVTEGRAPTDSACTSVHVPPGLPAQTVNFVSSHNYYLSEKNALTKSPEESTMP